MAAIALAGLLMATALAKAVSPYDDGLAIPIWWYYGMCLVETLLGMGLLSRFAVACAWVSILLFAAGGLMVMLVDTPCGCFGSIVLAPKTRLVVDGLGGLLAVAVVSARCLVRGVAAVHCAPGRE